MRSVAAKRTGRSARIYAVNIEEIAVEYRTLGRTGLKVSVLGFGTGGLDPLGIGRGRSEEEMRRLIWHAFDHGINLFDTAPGYGDGRSERILGDALRELPREDVVVSTKIPLASGMPGEPIQIMEPSRIRAYVDESLTRLKLDFVDVMLMAVWSPEYLNTMMNDQLPELRKLQQEGKIRFIGSSEVTRLDGSHEWLLAILPQDVLDVIMVGHNLLNQSACRSVFPLCCEKNVGAMNVFTVRNIFWNMPRLKEVIADLKQRRVLSGDAVSDDEPLGWLVEGDCGSLVEAAYRYAACTEGVTSVVCGTIDPAKLDEDLAFIAKGPLPAEKVERLRRTFGHIDEAIGN